MSSEYPVPIFPGLGQAGMCIDGYTDNSNGWNFCQSQMESNPWLSVEVPGGSTVGYVVVHSREDCCHDYLGEFQIWIGNTAGAPPPPF
eukprot:1820928-Prymnesium_polylepis.2